MMKNIITKNNSLPAKKTFDIKPFLFLCVFPLVMLSSCASLADSMVSKTLDAVEMKVVDAGKALEKETPSMSANDVEPTKENVIAAIKANNFDTLKGLLRKVDDVKEITGSEALLLHMAEEACGDSAYTSPVVELLVEKKAYTMQVNERGLTWDEYMDQMGGGEGALVGSPRWEYVQSVVGDKFDKRREAVKNDDLDAIKELEPYGVIDESLLVFAVQRKAVNIAHYVLSKEVSPSYKRPRDGNSLLHMVCWDRNSTWEDKETLVSMLIEAGADVNAVNKKGQTPLYAVLYITYSSTDGSPAKVANILLDAGADASEPALPALAVFIHEPGILDRLLTGNPGWSPDGSGFNGVFANADEDCRSVFLKHGINPDV